MRKLMFLAAAALPLAACATSPYGYNNSNPYGSSGVLGALGGVLGASSGYNSGYGYNSSSFQQAAVNSCARTAARYGQVSVTQVRQVSRSTLRVYGQVRTNYRARNWDCDFRSDGRITDFDI